MTTATASLTSFTHGPRRACALHGILDVALSRCPRCDRSTYDLDNEDDVASLRRLEKLNGSSRRRLYGTLGAVAAAVLATLPDTLQAAAAGNLYLHLDINSAVGGGFLAYAATWALRTPAQRALTQALRR